MLSGNVVSYCSKGPGLDSWFCRGIFLWWITILSYIKTGKICVLMSFVHVLPCVVFGGGPCILVITGQGCPPVVSVFLYLIYRNFQILWNRDKWYKRKLKEKNRIFHLLDWTWDPFLRKFSIFKNNTLRRYERLVFYSLRYW